MISSRFELFLENSHARVSMHSSNSEDREGKIPKETTKETQKKQKIIYFIKISIYFNK